MSTAVRIVAASSFAFQSYARTIGTGRLALHTDAQRLIASPA
jgi:hypothetical protein